MSLREVKSLVHVYVVSRCGIYTQIFLTLSSAINPLWVSTSSGLGSYIWVSKGWCSHWIWTLLLRGKKQENSLAWEEGKQGQECISRSEQAFFLYMWLFVNNYYWNSVCPSQKLFQQCFQISSWLIILLPFTYPDLTHSSRPAQTLSRLWRLLWTLTKLSDTTSHSDFIFYCLVCS